MNKTEYFIKELNFIENYPIREITEKLIGQLPDYFFTVPASSTGKYHPEYALGEGGLVRHTQAAVRIANDLLRLEMFKGLLEKKDLIISALLLHDGLKYGYEHQQFARADHPVLAAEFVKNSLQSNVKETEIINEIASLIETHMGQWNTDWKGGTEIMPKPQTKAQAFVHLCDYLASRKFLEFNFEV